MTVGILVTPSGLPALISDTMGWVEGRDNHKGLPAFHHVEDVESSVEKLFRKSLILTDKLAITVAGEFNAISDFVRNLKSLLLVHNEVEAVKKLLELSSDYSSVEAIIVNAVQDGLSLRTEFWTMNVSRDCSAKTELLGNVITIGSGARKALSQAIKYSETAKSFDEMSRRPFELIASFSQSMAGIKARNEAIFDEKLSWGGFVESVYFDLPSGRWRRSPKCLYLFYDVQLIEEGSYTTNLIGKAFAYEPGTQHGGVFVKEFAEDGAFGFEALIEDSFASDGATSFGASGWYSWSPQVANICFLVPNNSAGFKNCNMTTVDNEINGIVFEVDAETTRFGMSDWLVDFYSTKAYQYTGWKYVPARTL